MSTDTPERIGHLRVSGQLGREGGAVLFRALDPSGRPVTVQLLSARLPPESAAYEQLRHGADNLTRNHHPNLVNVLGAGQEGDRPYLILEAFDGAPLSEILRSRRLTTAEAFAVMKALCRGLAHAHEHGVVHRHVWPHALRVSPDLSQVKLTEFGFARVESMGMTGTINTGALSLGAFHYLAPEQTNGKPVDHRTDLYAAGVVFQEMLTGVAPGGGVTLPSQLNSELPPATDTVILKCLERHPVERYATAIDLLDDIAKLEESMKVRLLSEIRGITGSGARKVMVAGVIFVLLALVVAGVVLLG
jgi:serine/threonine protein kinase